MPEISVLISALLHQWHNFPFSGWKESFFGDLHGQGRHAIEFFTQTKVVIERWPKEWSRKF
jgi:malonate-semialdehyde dehydrogenase (acetylating)/methylmalonate-semialdehyde dehydrogenase